MKYFMNIKVSAKNLSRFSKFIFGIFDFEADKMGLVECVRGIVTDKFDLEKLGFSIDDLEIDLVAFNNITLPEPEQLTSQEN